MVGSASRGARYLFVIHGLVPLSRTPLALTSQESELLAKSAFLRNAHGSFETAIVRLATHSPTLTAGGTVDFEKELSADPILTSKARPKLVRPTRLGPSRLARARS